MRTCIIASLRDAFLTKEAETVLYNGFSGTHFVYKSEHGASDGGDVYKRQGYSLEDILDTEEDESMTMGGM